MTTATSRTSKTRELKKEMKTGFQSRDRTTHSLTTNKLPRKAKTIHQDKKTWATTKTKTVRIASTKT